MASKMGNCQQTSDPGDPTRLARRRFLSALMSVTLGALSSALVGIPVLGFLVGPLLRRSPVTWRTVGPVDHFKIGDTVEVTFPDVSPLPWAGMASDTGAWLRREGEQEFVAFTIYCSHLGCPVRWLPDADLFMCPCHGGVYYKDGRRAAGPPPRGLARYPVRVHNGYVEIQTTPVPLKGRLPAAT
jgi:menaquinol-cytochrome c reductase iron-sulfur subunit